MGFVRGLPSFDVGHEAGGCIASTEAWDCLGAVWRTCRRFRRDTGVEHSTGQSFRVEAGSEPAACRASEPQGWACEGFAGNGSLACGWEQPWGGGGRARGAAICARSELSRHSDATASGGAVRREPLFAICCGSGCGTEAGWIRESGPTCARVAKRSGDVCSRSGDRCALGSRRCARGNCAFDQRGRIPSASVRGRVRGPFAKWRAALWRRGRRA